MGAVDHWFKGDNGVNDELLEDLKAYGADASVLPERLLKGEDYEVWPENEEAVMMFLRCQTQWRTTSIGVMGLDYGVVLQMMDLYAVDRTPELMEDLQIMESRARQLINEEAAKSMKGSTQQPGSNRRGR
jgi:hypothetical protein